MALVVALFFDQETHSRLLKLSQELGAPGSATDTGAYAPHLTLAQFSSASASTMAAKVGEFSAIQKPFQIRMEYAGSFPTNEGVVFAAPLVTRELLGIHERFHELFHEYRSGVSQYYLPGKWVPHVTMAAGVPRDRLGAVSAFLASRFQPFFAGVDRVGLISYPPPKLMASFSLRS